MQAIRAFVRGTRKFARAITVALAAGFSSPRVSPSSSTTTTVSIRGNVVRLTGGSLWQGTGFGFFRRVLLCSSKNYGRRGHAINARLANVRWLSRALRSFLVLTAAVLVASNVFAQTVDHSTVQAETTSLSLPAGSSTYLFGYATGGAFASSSFTIGQTASVTDPDGFESVALAVTSSNSDSFTTSTVFQVMAGVGVSNYSSLTATYGSNSGPGQPSSATTGWTLSASANFTVSVPGSLVVLIGLGSSQQTISISGIPNLTVDGSSTVEGVEIAHAYPSVGSYSVTVNTVASAAGQDPYHAADLIGAFVFTPASPSGIGPAGGTVNPQGTSGEPISTGSGNYYYQHIDFAIPGRGLPLVFQRSYNTLDNYSGPLGVRWTHTYNIFLTPTANGAEIEWGDGHGETYMLSGGSYVPQPGVFNTLVENGDGTFTLTTPVQTKSDFSAAGRLTSIVDKNGNRILFAYDGSGNLAQITDTVGRTLTLTYDSNNRIVKVSDPIGRAVTYAYDSSDNLVQAVDAAGGVTTFAYDSSGRVTSVTLPNGNTLLQNAYDGLGRVISQTNGRGFTWHFAYDTPGAGKTTITDALGNKTVHAYDSSLRITQIQDALGGTVSYTYDANNDRIGITNQNGQTTNLTYDGRGNVTSITDPLGDTSALTYDANNDLLTSTNPRGEITTFSYDASGNLILVKNPLGNATSFEYDSFGELASTTDANGDTTTFTYDALGNLASFADPLGNTTNSNHDGVGRLISVTDPTGHAWKASYDPLDRLIARTDPLSNETQYSFDPVGNLLGVTDANGHTTSYSYDATNDLVAVIDALGHVTSYGYDADDNRSSFTNAHGNTTSYAYDALNRLTKVTDPLGFVTSYTYDPVGNLASETDAKGQTNSFSHDALNRLIGISYADGSNVAYTYDADSNRTSMVDPHGTTTYSHDLLDRLVSVSFPGGNTVGYSYDAVGERQSLTYPDGRVTEYSYDAARHLASVTDWLNRKTAYSYDADSNLLGVSYPNGAGLSFSYDAANRLVQVVNSYGPGFGGAFRQISRFTYLLDRVGNRVQVTNGTGDTTRFSYDALNELVSARDDSETVSFSYDPDGNRLTQQTRNGSTTYSYDADDRLLKETAAPEFAFGPLHSAETAAFTYDADGNRITKASHGGTTTYFYDSANRLIQVGSRRQAVTFEYDGDGNRIAQGAASYVNDVATPLPVVLLESGPRGATDYVYGLGRIAQTTGWTAYFYQYDALASVVGLTDRTGHLTTSYSYDPWGNAELLFPPERLGTTNEFGFTGEALDPETGLYYLRARYYDPKIGTFLSEDQFPGFAVIPLSANRYAYADNNPLYFQDPSGKCPQCITALIGAAGGALVGYLGLYAQNVIANEKKPGDSNPWAPTYSWQQYAYAAGTGALEGALAGACFGACTAADVAVGSVVTGGLSISGDALFNNGQITPLDGVNTAIEVAASAVPDVGQVLNGVIMGLTPYLESGADVLLSTATNVMSWKTLTTNVSPFANATSPLTTGSLATGSIPLSLNGGGPTK
jgi:RHS repeat-associated protein